MRTAETVRKMFEALYEHYGPQQWWPAETPFEVMVGAVLAQNTSWKNVSKAIQNLKNEDLLRPRALYELDLEELAELIRPAGYFTLKAKRLRNLLKLVVEKYGGRLERMFATDLPKLREELLSVNGVGPETADSILLYAAGKPTFVVDTYTHRVFLRHGLVEADIGYEGLKEFCEDHVSEDVAHYNEYHALLVRVGHEFCKPRPKCDDCPLKQFLPAGGPLGGGEEV